MPEYFTLAELRALPGLADTGAYPDARLEAAAAFVVETIERVVGTSFIARSVTEQHSGLNGRLGIPTRKPYVISVTSATESGVAVTDSLVALDGSDVIYKFSAGSRVPTPWQAGMNNISITYQAGYSSAVPADLKEAALYASRQRLITTSATAGQSTRRTRLTTEAGVFDLAVPGEDAPFGMPEIDAVVIGYRDRLDCHGFA